ncbi:MAG: response regulator, partial [Candidatus Sabulitectum sp.]|nr:response regulator [Candidatus Sabulitectum sp.]
LGHTADTANHGDEAIKKYTEAMKAGNPFDLVIMDLTIRDGKGGKKTIEELLEIYPEAKVIVSSGYSSGPIMANFSSYGFSGKLAKPFMAADLQDAIVTVMKSE